MNDYNNAEEAIRELFLLYANDVFRYARLVLGSHTEAKDVVQDVFLKAFRAWGDFRQESKGRTWLLHITRNHVFDLLRRKRTERNYIESYQMPVLRDETVSVEILMVLEASLLKLKPTYRDVFILRHVEELTVTETAQILNWSEGKVRTTDYRALAKLRELMQSDVEEVKVGHEF